MNAADVMRYGHLTLLASLDRVPDDQFDRPGACGDWSVKDIIAHLGSYELVLIDILNKAKGGDPAPVLDRFRQEGNRFNDVEVSARRDRNLTQVLTELNDAHAAAHDLLQSFEPDRLRTPGSIAWYGPDYSLDDLIVYMYYGHKREHAAQIEALHDGAITER
ncbi:MAG: maleylpyruvate isomerase N-terminal domain-containing protein [Chloroflexota bacterium]|nr:maleylpyruvate isomerase N-terminal domain-containing protein [Chloroflexota bacterium]